MSEPINLYYDLLSHRNRTLFMFLKLTKISFEGWPISIRNGNLKNIYLIITLMKKKTGHHPTDYRTISRFGHMSCMDDDGFLLTDTAAILKYLLHKHEATLDAHWYPRDLQARARVDEWMHMADRRHLANFVRLHWELPGGHQSETAAPSPARLQAARRKMERTLDRIEGGQLRENRFVAGGDEMSIADLLAVNELHQLCKCVEKERNLLLLLYILLIVLADYDPSAGRPNIRRYMRDMRQRTQPHFDEANLVLNTFVCEARKMSKL